MLGHAFNSGAVRIQFTVDARNERSQAAVVKLGVVREGILRRDANLERTYPRHRRFLDPRQRMANPQAPVGATFCKTDGLASLEDRILNRQLSVTPASRTTLAHFTTPACKIPRNSSGEVMSGSAP